MLTIAFDAVGRELSVENLAGVLKTERPQMFCFECQDALVPKLGSVVRHHFAHRSGSVCPVSISGGEGERHLMAKLRLRAALRELAQRNEAVTGLVICTCRRVERGPMILLKAGDVVEVERQTVGSYRPDISVLRDGQLVAAFEVVVTHKSDHDKWAAFEKLGIPVVELHAKEVIDEEGHLIWQPNQTTGKNGWRTSSAAQRYQCADCFTRELEFKTVPRHSALVASAYDRFHPDGSTSRYTFVLSLIELDGKTIGARLYEPMLGPIHDWPAESASDVEALIKDAKVARDRRMAEHPAPPGTITDARRFFDGRKSFSRRRYPEEEVARLRATQRWWWDGSGWVRAIHPAAAREALPGVPEQEVHRFVKHAWAMRLAPAKGQPKQNVIAQKQVERFAARLSRSERST
jgi:hypothetical protein